MRIYQIGNPLSLQLHLAQQYQIYHLVKGPDEDHHWQPVNADAPPSYTHRSLTHSPKTLFFRETENLFTFDGQLFRETRPQPQPFALFGVHSCDLTAIAYQDQLFAKDPYYQSRRQQALLIGLDCLHPCEQGFCHIVDAGPGVDTDYADLILHQHQQGLWLLLVSNKRAEQALTGLNLLPASIHALRQREQALNQCEKLFDDKKFLADGIQALSQHKVPSSFWQDAGQKNTDCSECTVRCPTCSCYTTAEQVDQHTIRQQRYWDSCLCDIFQGESGQLTSSLNPGERVCRFWTHKFTMTGGRYGCVGCGRCERTCPGVAGIHSTMKKISAYAYA